MSVAAVNRVNQSLPSAASWRMALRPISSIDGVAQEVRTSAKDSAAAIRVPIPPSPPDPFSPLLPRCKVLIDHYSPNGVPCLNDTH
ncbi:hypothetical protein Arth_0708 [Arthrobacter sp. FB24]|nr:hypothetical protein Arth_0708 [Arthrobacter sp. FB24]